MAPWPLPRHRPGAGLARRWFTSSRRGEDGIGRLGGVTDDGRIRILTAQLETARARRRTSCSSSPRRLASSSTEVEVAPHNRISLLGADARVPHRHARRRPPHPRRRAAQGNVEEQTGRPFADAYPHGPHMDQRFTPYPGEPFDDTAYSGRRMTRPSAGRRAPCASTLTSTPARSPRATASPPTTRVTSTRCLPRGRSRAGTGYATIEEMKLIDGRYLNDRLATYLIRARRAADSVDPGREAVLGRSARREGHR